MESALLAHPKVGKLRLAAFLCLNGCLIEVLQYFSGYRFGDWQDALADGVGVMVGMMFYVIVSNFVFVGQALGQDASALEEDPSTAKNPNLSAPTISNENKKLSQLKMRFGQAYFACH